jgi:D-alanine-D-alanine ligase
MKHVAVLMGGWSSEREISLVSGKAVVQALAGTKYMVTPVDVGRDIASVLSELKPDVAFNALHGPWGEDGCVQGLLETLDIPYTHSGVMASAVAMDKDMTNRLCATTSIRVPEGRVVHRDMLFEADPMPRPFVVKPLNEGSSVGVVIVTEDSNLGSPISRDAAGPWQTTERLLVEAFIPGRELTVSVMGDKALGVTELRPQRGFYDYDAKYTSGLTEHLVPAPVDDSIAEQAQEMALMAHKLLRCRGVTRSDFRFDEERGADGLYFLEINTQPGLTPLSLVPEQAKHQGIDFKALCEWIVEDASCHR